MLNFLLVVLGSILAIALFLLLAKIFNLPSEIKRKKEIRKKEQRLAELLDGQELNDILEASPYKLSRGQGDNWYGIYDKELGRNKLGSAQYRLDAELWIVEKHFSTESTAKIFLYK